MTPMFAGMQYQSVPLYGSTGILTNPAEKRHILHRIMYQYGAGTHVVYERDPGRVMVIGIDPASTTGKNTDMGSMGLRSGGVLPAG